MLVDRYVCFPDCKNLASHFCSLINTVALYSYTLDATGELQPRSAHVDPVKESDLFCSELSDSVKDLTSPSSSSVTVEGVDTWVFPTVQMGPLGIRQDEQTLLWLLKQLPSGADLHLSSPYFNLTPAYEEAILEAAREKSVHILTGSPKVILGSFLINSNLLAEPSLFGVREFPLKGTLENLALLQLAGLR